MTLNHLILNFSQVIFFFEFYLKKQKKMLIFVNE